MSDIQTKKSCGNCQHYRYDNSEKSYVCYSVDSERCAEAVEKTECCDSWVSEEVIMPEASRKDVSARKQPGSLQRENKITTNYYTLRARILTLMRKYEGRLKKATVLADDESYAGYFAKGRCAAYERVIDDLTHAIGR